MRGRAVGATALAVAVVASAQELEPQRDPAGRIKPPIRDLRPDVPPNDPFPPKHPLRAYWTVHLTAGLPGPELTATWRFGTPAVTVGAMIGGLANRHVAAGLSAGTVRNMLDLRDDRESGWTFDFHLGVGARFFRQYLLNRNRLGLAPLMGPEATHWWRRRVGLSLRLQAGFSLAEGPVATIGAGLAL